MILKHFLLLQLIFTIFSSNAQGLKKDTIGNSFHINGNFIGNNTKFIVLSYLNADNKMINDTCNIVNHQFSFSGYLKEPAFALIMTNFASNWVGDSNNEGIFIEPNDMQINLEENHFKSLKIYGSKTQSQFDSLENSKLFISNKMAPLAAELNALNDSISISLKKRDTAKVQQIYANKKMVLAAMQPYKKQLNQIDLKYVKQNPNAYLSAYLLRKQYEVYRLEKDSVRLYFNRLASNIQNSSWGKEVRKKLDGVIPIGTILPNLSGTNSLGGKTSLNDLIKSNYTLIIFWASWCEPCRKLVPAYKSLYTKYHKKGLNIIAITWDEKKENWLSAIKKDNISNWENIFPIIGAFTRSDYGLSSIPAEILLRKNVIIGKYAGADGEHSDVGNLENKLKQIFSER